jgi:hypothetical protein
MFRTVGDRPSLWESQLPAEVLRLPGELARVDALLDDPAFLEAFRPFLHPVLGRPCTPVECYLRLMFLKFRYRLGYESLCAEVSDSVSWRRSCRIPLDGRVPHPTTLMKLTTRCGAGAVAGLNEALLAWAAGQELLRTARVRAGTRAASTAPSSSATRPRSPTTTTASSWTTPWSTATSPTAPSSSRPSGESPAGPAACRGAAAGPVPARPVPASAGLAAGAVARHRGPRAAGRQRDLPAGGAAWPGVRGAVLA